MANSRRSLSTFSIVARDARTGDLGIAVQSRFIAVGAVVPWAKANVGAIATQAWANVSYGPIGLELLERGLTASEVLAKLLEADEKREHRQVGIVDAEGNVAAFTGKECYEWAGHIIGGDYCCLGNILAGEAVIKGMAEAFEKTRGDLIDKLLFALEAGQAAGGDRRGQQSAALLVVREKGGYEGLSDRYVDIRVDDHPKPIEELKRIFRIYDMTLLNREDPRNIFKIEGELAREIQSMLARLGFYKGGLTGVYDEATRKAFRDFINISNFENKMRDDDYIWGSILDYLRDLTRRLEA